MWLSNEALKISKNYNAIWLLHLNLPKSYVDNSMITKIFANSQWTGQKKTSAENFMMITKCM